MSMQGTDSKVTYYVDEAGDGVLFGRKGRVIIDEINARRYFMLGMVRCQNDRENKNPMDIGFPRSEREPHGMQPIFFHREQNTLI